MTITLGKTRMSPQEFSSKWASIELKESASAKEHFLDLCALVGSPTPADVDKTGTFFTFEKGVEKAGGGKGFADVWLRGHFAIEYKGKHKDLNAAYKQLLQYHESLGNPPLLVVTDMDRYEVHTKFDGVVTEVHPFTNEELPKPENLRVLRAIFEDPDSLRSTRTVKGVTEEAARKFAWLADGMRARGVEPHEAAHFLNKLLFCLFAEDIGLLPKGLFTRVVERTKGNPDRFASYIRDLFTAMRDGGDFLLKDIPRFNGGLYESGEIEPLTSEELGKLVEAARLDWGAVEPAIFGTLFERSLDPAQRARLGAHYTSREDILTVVEPVLMAPLRREWEEIRARAEAEAEQARNLSGQKAVNALRRAERLLGEIAERLRGVHVLDPACGSGNFLYVSLKELLDLEKEVSTFAGTMGLTPFFPGVSPEQLYGIETSPYAHELAQVAIWIGYLQWMVENGFGTRKEPILGPMTNIREMDALISRENGELKEPEWPEADVIVGNPPFLGDKKMRAELGHGYVEQLRRAYEGRVPGGADLVCYWYEKAREQVADGKTKRVGLLATNSIRGGKNQRVLQRIKESGDIFFGFMRAEWFGFKPSHKIWLSTNHKPEIRGTDNAIWRRIRLIPWNVTVPKNERDRKLPDKLRDELPGVLGWIVRGCLQWQREGLKEPDEVRQATAAYRGEMDTLAAFIADECVVSENTQAAATPLFETYVRWCDANGERSDTQRRFGARLGERGYESFTFTSGPHKDRKGWRGIGLRADKPDPDDNGTGGERVQSEENTPPGGQTADKRPIGETGLGIDNTGDSRKRSGQSGPQNDISSSEMHPRGVMCEKGPLYHLRPLEGESRDAVALHMLRDIPRLAVLVEQFFDADAEEHTDRLEAIAGALAVRGEGNWRDWQGPAFEALGVLQDEYQRGGAA